MLGKLVVTTAIATLLAATAASATVAPSLITITPSPVAINAQQNTLRSLLLTVTNISGAPLKYGAASLSGADAGDFTVLSDSCAYHTIRAGRPCRIKLGIQATQPVGTVETAEVSVNDPSSASLGVDDISATVKPARGLTVTAKGLVITINNPTTQGYNMDYSVFGANLQVTGGTCVDYIFPTSSCTLLVANPPGEVQVDIGGLGTFDLFF